MIPCIIGPPGLATSRPVVKYSIDSNNGEAKWYPPNKDINHGVDHGLPLVNYVLHLELPKCGQSAGEPKLTRISVNHDENHE